MKFKSQYLYHQICWNSLCLSLSLSTSFQHKHFKTQTGRLNMSNRGLEEFPVEITEMEKHLEADEKFWECEALSRVDLGHNRIVTIPITIASVR